MGRGVWPDAAEGHLAMWRVRRRTGGQRGTTVRVAPPPHDVVAKERNIQMEGAGRMSQNYGNRHVSAEKWDAIDARFVELQREVKDAVSVISGEQRQRALRMGDGSVAFVDKALEVARQNPGLLRRSFDIDEFQRDVESRRRLHAFEMQLTQMLEQVRNAAIAHGSDAMSGALEVYASVKDDEGDGADGLRRLLGKRFVRNAPKPKSETA
jgi:hypothetical protein